VDDDYDKVPVEEAILSEKELAGTTVRLPMIYGPGDPLHRLHWLLKRMDDGRPFIILPDDMAAWRGVRGYVENVGAAIALVCRRNRQRVAVITSANRIARPSWNMPSASPPLLGGGENSSRCRKKRLRNTFASPETWHSTW